MISIGFFSGYCSFREATNSVAHRFTYSLFVVGASMNCNPFKGLPQAPKAVMLFRCTVFYTASILSNFYPIQVFGT